MATKFDSIRNVIMDEIKGIYSEKDYDVLQTGSQEICLPIVSEDGDESYLVITFKIPKGSRDGDPYDGYLVAKDFEEKQKEKIEKARLSKIKKEEKAKKDAEMRKAKADAKAKREKDK